MEYHGLVKIKGRRGTAIFNYFDKDWRLIPGRTYFDQKMAGWTPIEVYLWSLRNPDCVIEFFASYEAAKRADIKTE